MRRRLDPRSDPAATLTHADQVWAFRSALDDDFCDGVVASFPSREAAMRAWPSCRFEVWSATCRMTIPDAARQFDGLTSLAREHLWSASCRYEEAFPLDAIVGLLDADRAALQAFRERDPMGARSIADFLEMWRADLDAIERIAQALAAARDSRAIHDLSSANTYGDGSDAA
jgi:hypothetical protein